MLKTTQSLILALAMSVLAIGEAAAQRPTAAITGFVRQAPETAVDGADVVARNVATGFEYRGSTSTTGQYWLRGLPPGQYDVTVRRIGMQPVSRDGVELTIGRTATIDFLMGAAAVQLEGIEVSAAAPLVATTESNVAFVIDRKMLAVLPQESRQFLDLAQLVPGATKASLEGRGTQFGSAGSSVGALNTQSLGVVIDGADFTEALFGELSGSVPLLAIQEFEVIQTQYSAQFGRAASGVVNAVTRRGGNETVFEAFGLYRHKALNALGEFETEKPNFNRSHWGAAFGGPIVRDRTHFFTAFERRVQNDFVTVNTNGVFPALEGTVSTPFTDNLFFARLDHRVNNRHELTLRFSGETGDRLSLTNFFGGAAAADHANRISQDMYSALLTHRWSISDAVLNESQLHVTNRRFSNQPVTTEGASFVYPSIVTGPFFNTDRMATTRIELKNDLSWATTGRSGTHRLQFGTQLSWQRSEGATQLFIDNAACIFLADTDPAPIFCRVGVGDQLTFGVPRHRNLQVGVYAQDDWTITPNLTLNLGLRYDIETNGTNQNFVSPYAEFLPFSLQTERSVDKNNIAPRIGFAFDPAADGRTVIRGGFGIFYDALVSWPLVGLEQSSGIKTVDVFFPTTTDIDQLRAGIDPSTVPPLVWPTGDIKTPMTRQFSLGVERALPSDVVIRVDGIYSQGRNLLIERNLQRIDPVTGPRYPEVGNVFQILSRGLANAKMLLVDVRKTFPAGWVNVNYTLADRQNTNDVWQEFVTQTDPDNEDFSSLLGPAAWDERHRLVGTGHVNILDVLGVTGKVIYSSARPFTALTGTDDNLDGEPQGPNDIVPGEGRNARRGPNFFRTDVSINWDTAPVGGRNIGLMLNVYNLFNTTNLDPETIVALLPSELFGQALGARAKRQVEVGVQIR